MGSEGGGGTWSTAYMVHELGEPRTNNRKQGWAGLYAVEGAGRRKGRHNSSMDSASSLSSVLRTGDESAMVEEFGDGRAAVRTGVESTQEPGGLSKY